MGLRNVLVVDDEASIRHLLSVILVDHGYDPRAVATGEEALKELAVREYDLVLTDVRMPGMGGLGLLREIQRTAPELMVIVMSAYGAHDAAIEAMKTGAYDYLSKPFKPDEVVLVLRKAEERERLARENRRLRTELSAGYSPEHMVGTSEPMREVSRQIRKIAQQKTTVLVQGESGTGKELVARAIHQLSPRAALPFVAVNCGAIPPELIESELFGHVKGAFTDAIRAKKGLAVEADGGTLFLDEIGELPLELQAKFLRVLEERKIRRLGGRSEVEVDVRVICATNRDLKEEIRRGRFREDLYFRLHVFSILLPTLKERREDVPLLVHHFIEKFNAETGKRVQGVSPAAMAVLQGYAWPGNIRELRNTVERAMILVDGEVIGEEQLPPDMPASRPEAATLRVPLGLHIDKVEKEYILASLQRNGGNKARTAEILGISEKTLYNKLNRYAAEARSRGEASEGDPAAAGGAKA